MAALGALGAIQVQNLKPVGRVTRRPAHTFQLRSRPWAIQPFMIAPVLPGETLKNLLLQARVYSDPVASPLVGWWKEYFFFYVKLRDLDGRDDFSQMILTPGFDLSGYDAAANAVTYHAGPGIDWVSQCLDRVTAEYFRDEGEAVDIVTLDGLPLAAVNNSSWLDSAKLGSDVAADLEDDQLLGVDPDLPAFMAGWENHYAQWQHMRALKLTEATFEDWLRSFGVSAPKDQTETHKPELVRYVRDWTYPTDTVDSAGDPASRVQWSIAERADKDRFFKEPGFLFGVTVTRAKVYMGNQTGAAVGMMNDAFSFLPAIMADEVYTSLREFQVDPAGTGPLGVTPSGAYWVDLRDLFLYGDQFSNFAMLSAGDAGAVALPTASMGKRYLDGTKIDGLFADTLKKVYEDGVCTLSILGSQRDTT
jgi:hypothetical protein